MRQRYASQLLALPLCLLGAVSASANEALRGQQHDVLQLESSSVTGNQELPKVMYIVPWRDAGMADLAGRPVNSLLDAALAPVDREEFQRHIRYFSQLEGSAGAPGGD